MVKNKLINRIKLWLAYAFAGIAAVSLVAMMFIDEHLAVHSPKTPIQETGQIYFKVIHHGIDVYLTNAEYLFYQYFTPAVAFVGCLAGVFYSRVDKSQL